MPFWSKKNSEPTSQSDSELTKLLREEKIRQQQRQEQQERQKEQERQERELQEGKKAYNDVNQESSHINNLSPAISGGGKANMHSSRKHRTCKTQRKIGKKHITKTKHTRKSHTKKK